MGAAATGSGPRARAHAASPPQDEQERLLQNQLFGVKVDRNCMRDTLDKPNACGAGGPDCGKVGTRAGRQPTFAALTGPLSQCVRVLATCNPDPAPVAVYPDCMKKCLAANEDCSMCVDVHADCAFGQ